MALKDKIKWDKKYNETPKLLQERPPSVKLINIIDQIKGKKALDIACGAGKNSIFLAKKGFDVDALDISDVALKSLKNKNYKNIHTKQIDLEGFIPQKNTYDLIVKTNYLDREIIPHLSQALKKEGVLFIETYMDHPENTKPNTTPGFLLKEGELKTFFDDSFEILEYDEFDNEAYELYRMKKQVIIVKKC